MLYVLYALILAVIFVNGLTDAPNAITCVVSTGALPYHKAVQLAAVCNLLGILVMGLLNASVADTVSNIVSLDYTHPSGSVAVLCATMAAIVLFGTIAWYFGIPTSESHALVAALTGAAVAQGQFAAINPNAWGKILIGLAVSLVMGLGFGRLVTQLFKKPFLKASDKAFYQVQIMSGAGMAFMHGAQDGQKFIAIFVMARLLAKGQPHVISPTLHEHWPVMLLCAAVMAAGTMAGGRRIITNIGTKMVNLRAYQGAAADIGGALCLLLATVWGIPVSTTHTKTAAIMGAGKGAAGGKLDHSVVRNLFFAWIITFPACAAIGYVAASAFLRHLA